MKRKVFLIKAKYQSVMKTVGMKVQRTMHSCLHNNSQPVSVNLRQSVVSQSLNLCGLLEWQLK